MKMTYEKDGLFRWKIDPTTDGDIDSALVEFGESVSKMLESDEVPAEHKREFIAYLSHISGVEITSEEDLEKFLDNLAKSKSTLADAKVEIEKMEVVENSSTKIAPYSEEDSVDIKLDEEIGED